MAEVEREHLEILENLSLQGFISLFKISTQSNINGAAEMNIDIECKEGGGISQISLIDVRALSIRKIEINMSANILIYSSRSNQMEDMNYYIVEDEYRMFDMYCKSIDIN